MSGHAGRGIVHDEHGAGSLIVGHILQRVDAGVHKGGIADDRHPVLDIFASPGLLHAVERGDGGAHAHGRIDYGKGRNGT